MDCWTTLAETGTRVCAAAILVFVWWWHAGTDDSFKCLPDLLRKRWSSCLFYGALLVGALFLSTQLLQSLPPEFHSEVTSPTGLKRLGGSVMLGGIISLMLVCAWPQSGSKERLVLLIAAAACLCIFWFETTIGGIPAWYVLAFVVCFSTVLVIRLRQVLQEVGISGQLQADDQDDELLLQVSKNHCWQLDMRKQQRLMCEGRNRLGENVRLKCDLALKVQKDARKPVVLVLKPLAIAENLSI